MRTQWALPIEDPSQIAGARRSLQSLLLPLRFGDAAAARAALAVTELATNQLKHAGAGLLLLRVLERGRNVGLEVVAVDRGPGIRDVGASMRDGYSTAGSLGTGLGALQRVANELEIYSHPGKGTALRVELWREPPEQEDTLTHLGAVCVPQPGEEVCGDAWRCHAEGANLTLVVADGLGHGPAAASAAVQAGAVLERYPDASPQQLIEAMHGALAATRGAAVGVAQLDRERRTGVFAGVGNIAACVAGPSGETRQLPSYNGTVGHKLATLREFPFVFPPGALLVLHSDGLGTRWDLSAYPGLRTSHPALVAGVLYRDFGRGRDDTTVVVLRRAAS